MTKLKTYLGILIMLAFVILTLSLIRVRPNYVIFGINGCAPELFQVTDYNVKVDTTYYIFDRTTNVNLYEIGGCEFESNKYTSKRLKIKIPIIMLLDYRGHFGSPNSSGRYLLLEFKVLGFIKQFSIFEQSIPIYFRDLPKRINEKEELIGKIYGDSCFMKARYIECE